MDNEQIVRENSFLDYLRGIAIKHKEDQKRAGFVINERR